MSIARYRSTMYIFYNLVAVKSDSEFMTLCIAAEILGSSYSSFFSFHVAISLAGSLIMDR